MSFLIIGHRGMGPTAERLEVMPDLLPENSLAAFNRAIDLGADGLEFDVHVTKDGKLAVIHDDVLNKKVAGADRGSRELGLTSQYNLSALALLDIGNGHKVPSLEDVLDLIAQRNPEYKERTGKNLTIDIELKGKGTTKLTHDVVSQYITDGIFKQDDFLFNSFKWERLKELKAYDSQYKIMPAIKTADLFGVENVSMPGFVVDSNIPLCTKGLEKLAAFHSDVDCHAFDCVIFDLRPEFIDFCEQQGVGLFTSTSYESVKSSEILEPLALMLEAKRRLEFTGFRADDVLETNASLRDISIAQGIGVEDLEYY